MTLKKFAGKNPWRCTRSTQGVASSLKKRAYHSIYLLRYPEVPPKNTLDNHVNQADDPHRQRRVTSHQERVTVKDWYYATLLERNGAYETCQKIRKTFADVSKSIGVSKYAAIFSSSDIAQQSVTVYFSPPTSMLAKAFGASPCEKPTLRNNLTLLAGVPQSWGIHFPGHTPPQD